MSDDREWKLTDKKLKSAPASVLVSDLWGGFFVFVLGLVLGRCSAYFDIRVYPR